MAKPKKPLSPAARKKRAKQLLEKRVKKLAAQPKAVAPPEIAGLIARLGAMAKALGARKTIRLTGDVENCSMSERAIKKWEKQLRGSAPADFRAFLLHQGPFSLEWKFRKQPPNVGSGSIGSFDIVFPVKHPMKGVAGFEDLWLFWRDDHHQWAWKSGPEPQLMLENIDDDSILTSKPSFTEMLAEQIEWYGAKHVVVSALGYDAAMKIPVKNGLRSLAAIEEQLFAK